MPKVALVAQALSEGLTADPEDGSSFLDGDAVVVHEDILPNASSAASEAGRWFGCVGYGGDTSLLALMRGRNSDPLAVASDGVREISRLIRMLLDGDPANACAGRPRAGHEPVDRAEVLRRCNRISPALRDSPNRRPEDWPHAPTLARPRPTIVGGPD